MKHDPYNTRESKRKRKWFATVQLSMTEFLGKSDTPDQKKSFRKGKPANMLRFLSKTVILHKGINIGNCKLGNKVCV